MFKIKQYFRRRAWLRKHKSWENTRQKRKALEKYLNSFDKQRQGKNGRTISVAE